MSLWICADEIRHQCDNFYYFEKTFNVPTGATLTANVCADTRYILYVNGKQVCEGPCQSPTHFRYYETVDLTPYLAEGENHICAKVLHTEEYSFISVWNREQAALWLDGLLTADGVQTAFGTDETWICHREDSTHFAHAPGLHTSVPPYEKIMGEQILTPVKVRGLYEPAIANQTYNHFGLTDDYVLKPRTIPRMQTHPAREMTVVRRGEGFIELDAGEYTTAKVHMNIKADQGSVVRVIYAECYLVANDDGQRYKAGRADWTNETATLPGAADSIHTTGKEQIFDPFWYRSFRFIRIEFDPAVNFVLNELTISPYFYPLDETGSFECSDPRFNEMWKISRNTVLCCMHEMYVDCPYYEQQQYGMDSALEMLFTFRLGSDTKLPYKCICDLAASQMPDGMIQANYPSVRVQIIPDFTLFWVLMLRDYLRYTGDRAGVKVHLGTMDKALECFENLRLDNGLVGPTPYWPFVDWDPQWFIGVPDGGREEPLTVTCLMYAAALRAGSEIYASCSRPERAIEYARRAHEMTDLVHLHCYDETLGLYRNTPSRAQYSQHTTLWAILSGAVEGDEASALIDRTFAAMDDPEKHLAKCTFSMGHYLFRALEASNRYAYADKLFAGWQTMLDWGCTTWCENPDSPRSECHGWSSAPAYELSAMVLGVYPTSDGYETARIRPTVDGLGLTYAKGTVPTPHGIISVAWAKSDSILTVDITIPAGIAATCELPDGSRRPLSEGENHLICGL